jgi:hypothetical protein
MNSVTAAALGAGMMYLFDPEQGQARRAKIQDKCAGFINQSKGEFDRALQDLQDRARGCVAEARAALAEGEPMHGLDQVREELTQWTPATRLLATAGGGALAACVLGAISPKTLALAGIGAGVCAAVINNQQLQDMLAEGMARAEELATSAGQAAIQSESAKRTLEGERPEREPVRAEQD